MDFSLQSGNQISLKRDEKPSIFRMLIRKPDDSLDILNVSLLVISGVLLVISGGLYAYNMSLASNLNAKKAELGTKQAALSNLPIEEIRKLNTQLKFVNQFTNNYAYTETALEILAKSIENSVTYNSFKISKDQKSQYSIDVSGQADSYKALAQQMNTFDSVQQKKYLTDFKLKGFGLDKITGKVGFNFISGITFAGILPGSDVLNCVGLLDGEICPVSKSSDPSSKSIAP